MFTCVYTLHRLNPRLGTKLVFLVGSPFLLARSSRLTLVEAFQNDYVASCSTALRSATGTNEMGGYITVPCLSKTTQCSTTPDWFKF